MNLNVCMMFNNESLYLREWIEFHRMMGADKFYLYNRLSTDNWQSVLKPYIDNGIVDVKDWPYPGFHSGGREAYIDSHQDCIDRLRGRNEWLAMVDSDEFLFSPRYDTVATAIENMPQPWTSIGVHWMVFGPSDETDWRDAPMIERFTWRPSESHYFNRWYKSILRLDDPALNTLGSTHRYRTTAGTYNENGLLLLDNESLHTSSIFRLNHYITKSRPEWEKRKPLMQDGVTYVRDESRWGDVLARDVDDRTIQRFLPALKEKLNDSSFYPIS